MSILSGFAEKDKELVDSVEKQTLEEFISITGHSIEKVKESIKLAEEQIDLEIDDQTERWAFDLKELIDKGSVIAAFKGESPVILLRDKSLSAPITFRRIMAGDRLAYMDNKDKIGTAFGVILKRVTGANQTILDRVWEGHVLDHAMTVVAFLLNA